MKVIEFFGPPGAGKTYLKKKILSEFLIQKKVYSYKSINYLLANNSFLIKVYFIIVKNEFLKKILDNFIIRYFINHFSGYIYKEYKSNISNHLKPKSNNVIKQINLLIEHSIFKKDQKKLFQTWAYEEVNGSIISKQINDNDKLIIDSEGLIQRLFIYCYKKKNKKQIIKKYLKIINIPSVLIYFDNFNSKKKNFLNLKNKEMRKIFYLTLFELKKKKIIVVDSRKKLKDICNIINKL